MRIQLTDKAIFWALANPGAREYIGYGETSVGGYSKVDVQQTQITLTESQPVSEEFEFDSLPGWAKRQINTSKASGVIDIIGAPATAKPVVAERIETESEESGKIAEEDKAPNVTELLGKSLSVIKKRIGELDLGDMELMLEREKAGKKRIGLISFLEERINAAS